jgi:pimeloyl-ACP methyl ester carboxylesterase
MNADGSNQRRLLDFPVLEPAWSPDGTRIAFGSDQEGFRGLYVMDADGVEQGSLTLQKLSSTRTGENCPAWSPDGAWIAFASWRDGDGEIYVMDADGVEQGSPNLQKLTDNRFEEEFPAWRPEVSPPQTREIAPSPVFKPGPCRFSTPSVPAECGDLIVPKDRGDPDGATVSLHVAIFRSSSPNPEPDPVIYLMGGGGGNALDAADYYLRTVGNRIRESRDFIMYNQRGTRYNEPFLECPGEAAFRRDLDAQDLSRQEADARTEAFLRDCRDTLLDQGVDLTMYNSVTNAADANDLRIALGYEQVNYYGTSYGTRLGLTLLRYHPEGIRSVILDSVFPPQVDYPSDAITSMIDAINRVFEACSEDASCSAKYPDLEETFYQIIDDLQVEPGSITIDGRQVVVDDEVFLNAIYMALHPASAIPDIPRAIDAASHGRFEPLQWAIESLESYSENVATGVYYSSLCRDEVGFDSNEHALAVVSGYPPQYAAHWDLSSFFATCEWWGAGEADPIENEPVVSDVPALIFAGYFDPITTPAWCRRAAETLNNSFYYEFPNMGHGVMRSDQCALRIGLEFLDDPLTTPDASCLDEITGPEFR